MPLEYNERFDDPLAFTGTNSLIGGQVSNQRETLIADNQSARLLNCDVDQNGLLMTRRGMVKLGDLATASGSTNVQALFYFDTTGSPGYEMILAFVNGAMYTTPIISTWTGSTVSATWTEALSAVTLGWDSVTAPIWVTQIVGKVYASIGTGDMQVLEYNGTTWSATDYAAGTGYGPPTNITNLISVNHRLMGAELSNKIDIGKILPNDNTQLFNTIYQLHVGSGEGDPIVGISKWQKSVVAIFTEKSVHAINADPAVTDISFYPIESISENIGAAADKSIVQVGSDIFFLASDYTVRSLTTTFQQERQGIELTPMSHPVQDVLDRINESYAHLACATFWKGKYILAFPLDTSTVNNHILVYNATTRTWTGEWDGFNPIEFVQLHFGAQSQKLIWLDTNGHVQVYRDYKEKDSALADDFKDNGSFPTSIWTSRSYDWGAPANDKSPSHMELEFFESDAFVDIALIYDGKNSVDKATNVDTSAARVYLSQTLSFFLNEKKIVRKGYGLTDQDVCREMQVQLTWPPAGESPTTNALRFRQVITSAWEQVLDTEVV